MIYIITGESDIRTAKLNMWVADHIAGLPDVTAMVTGLAAGVDSVALLTGATEFPDAEHIVCRPAAPYNADALAWARANFNNNIKVLDAKPGRTRSESYMLRNTLMMDAAVNLADGDRNLITCVAFPWSLEPVLRNGTWSTIRRANTARITVDIRRLPKELNS